MGSLIFKMSVNTGTAVLFQGINDETKAPIITQTNFKLPTLESLEEGEVLVKLEAASICNSDIHTLQGRRKEPTPSILGHEGCGTVLISRREDVTVGTRVTFSIMDACTDCRNCKTGIEQKCVKLFKYGHSVYDGVSSSGCYSSHILLKSGTLIVGLPDSLPWHLAAPVNCALATMVAARRLAKKSMEERMVGGNCLIFGAGMLGIYGAVLMKECGMNVYITDVSEARLKLAESFGCSSLMGSDISKYKYDVAFEVCGVGRIVEKALPLLNPGGVIVLVGSVTPNTEFTITAEAVVRKCATIVGLHNYTKADLSEAVKFVSDTRDRYDYNKLMSSPIPLTHFLSGFSLALDQTYLRVILDNTK